MTVFKLQKICKILLLIFICLIPDHIYGQQEKTININDLSQLEVDELSDDQIRQFVERAAESGMTMEQLEAVALTKGMPYTEITKLQKRIDKLDSPANSDILVKRDGEQRIVRANDLSTRKEVFQDLMPAKKLEEGVIKEEELKVFGSEIFKQENLTFMPSMNIPTPKNYTLGQGDELLIEVYGASQESYSLTINPDGWVKINNLAPVSLSGLTIEEASSLLNRKMSSIYSGMKGANPNTFAKISLGDLRSINVNIAGEVEVPGTYTLPSLATVMNALYLSGGPNERGSYRKIHVIRDNVIIAEIDLYDFLLRGLAKNNIRLQDDDIIFIEEYFSRVIVEGEVKRPAIYEIRDSKSLEDVIAYAGGFSENAFTNRVKIRRNTSDRKSILDISRENYSITSIQNGDEIFVGKLLARFENRVMIKGAVNREGEFGLSEGMTLKDLIKKAEGLSEDAILGQASLYRLQENLKTEFIPVDLSAIMNGGEDIKLKREDILIITSVFDLEENYTINISGEVMKPGEYPYYDKMNLGELLRYAGGLKESASLVRLEIARRIRDNLSEEPINSAAEVFTLNLSDGPDFSDKVYSFELQPFDIVFIRRSPGYMEQRLVNVEGEVAFPGEYSISHKQERISDLIKRAGGLSSEAYLEGATLYRKTETDEQIRKRVLDQLEKNSQDTLQVDNEGFMTDQPIGIDLPEILANPGMGNDLILKDGDRLKIPIELQTVRLSGALLYPVTVRYKRRKNLPEYVANAGGFADNSIKRKTYVLYANGSVDRTRSFLSIKNYPKIEPGAEIIVPMRPEKQKMSPQQAISMSSALASMALVLVTLIGRF